MSTTATPSHAEKASPDLAAAIDASLATRDEDASWIKRQEALVTIGRQAEAPVDVGTLRDEAAALLADSFEIDYCAIARKSPEGDRFVVELRRLRGPGDSRRPLTLSAAGGEGLSLAGHAWRAGHPVATANLAEERRFQDETLRQQGIRAALAAPLVLDGQVECVLIAASDCPRDFSANDLLFGEMLTQILAANIGRSEALKALENQRQLSNRILETVDALVLVLDCKGTIAQINRACEDLTGFSLDEVRGRSIGEIFPVGGESQLYERIFARLRRNSAPVEYESHLITKGSDRRRIAWSYAGKRDTDGQVDSIVVTGIDVTKQREAEERAARAEKLVDQQQAEDENAADENTAEGARHPATGSDERRQRPRLTYPYRQLIAPIVNGRLPSRQDFVELECHDIAVGGFSYYAPGPPSTDQVVIALGIPPRLTFLIAQIVHVRRVTRDSKSLYLTGCMYTGRAEY